MDGLFIYVVDLVDTFLGLLRSSTKHSLHTLLVYIAYHIGLIRNAIIFNSTRCLARVIVERAHVYAKEYLMMTAMTTETWSLCMAL